MSPRPTNAGGNSRRVAEDRLQHLDVLARRDAAEQHDLAVGADGRRAARGRPARAARGTRRCRRSIVDRRQTPRNDSSVTGVSADAQAGVRRDHQHAAGGDRIGRIRRPREPPRVGQLAAEVQPADEAEHVAERRALAALQLPRERELRRRRHHHPRADAAAVGRRQQEDARGWGRSQSLRHVSGSAGRPDCDQPPEQEERHGRDHAPASSDHRDDEQPVAGGRRAAPRRHDARAAPGSCCWPSTRSRTDRRRAARRPTSASIATLKIIRSCTTRGMPRSRACHRMPMVKSGETRSPRPGTRPRIGSRPMR